MQIGAYQIERELGRGGFGVVYIGVDTRLGRRAAIKQLLPELSGNREIVERFFNEAKAAANINHPGIVEVYDVGWHTDGSAYFAMKLLDGESLAGRLRARGPLPIGLACTIARQVASAVAAAHGRGIVHRDLKPDNIVLVADDEISIGERAVVLDFGIAKLGGTAGTSQTRTGMMMGTPSYMSPEQCKGAGEVDHRTDLYALGCILFEMLTGSVLFSGDGPGEVMAKHQLVEPPLLRTQRPDAPPALEQLISQLLAKKPGDRMQQMSAVHAALKSFTATASREHPAAFGPTEPMKPVPAPVEPVSAAAQAANKPPVSEPPAKTTLSTAQAELPAEPAKRSRAVVLGVGGAVMAATVTTLVVISSGGGSDTRTVDAAIESAPRTSLSREAFDDAIASVVDEIDACHKEYGLASFALSVTIEPSGSVSAVTPLKELAETPMAGCVSSVVTATAFPRWTGSPQTFTTTFAFGD